MCLCNSNVSHARIMKVLSGGPTFVFLDEGREDPNTTKSGPSSASQRNAIQMGFRWRAHDGSTLNADWLESFVIFKG